MRQQMEQRWSNRGNCHVRRGKRRFAEKGKIGKVDWWALRKKPIPIQVQADNWLGMPARMMGLLFLGVK